MISQLANERSHCAPYLPLNLTIKISHFIPRNKLQPLGASCMITHPHWEQEKLSQDKMTTVKNGKMRLFQDALTVSEISFMMTSQMVAALWIGMRIFPPSPLISLGTICTATGGIFRLLYSNGIYRAKTGEIWTHVLYLQRKRPLIVDRKECSKDDSNKIYRDKTGETWTLVQYFLKRRPLITFH